MASSKIKFIALAAGVGLVALIVAAQVSFVKPVAAAVKACAAHQGVNCSAGAAYDGSVVCNDGQRDASAMYAAQAECKAAFLRCPIALPKDAYDKQTKALQTIIDTLVSDNKKVCTDTFNNLEDLNKQMSDACKDGSSSCKDRHDKTAAYNKSNQTICLKSADDAVAKYKAMLGCLALSTDQKTVAYGNSGYGIPGMHPAYAGTCTAYGTNAVVNKAKTLCSCPDAWSWDKTNKFCVQNPVCQLGSSWSNGACVTNTKACINKYGVNSYSVTTTNNNHECRCNAGFKMNPEKTKCISG